MSSESKEDKEKKSTKEKGQVGLLGATTQGLAYSAPALSILATFTLVYIANFTYNAVSLSYLIAGIAVIFTAVSFAELVKAYPTRGSVWDFVTGETNKRWGLFTVWIYLLTILVAPAAALIPVGFYLFSWLGFPSWITVLISVITVLIIVSLGIKISVRLMALLLLVELGILFVFAFAAIGWSIANGIFPILAPLALSPEGSVAGWAGVIAGATIAIYGYMGFESPVTIVEEAKAGKKTIPRAIVLGAILITSIYFFLGWAFTLATSSVGPLTMFYGIVNPVPLMGQAILGDAWLGLLNLAGIIAGLTCAIAAITASSRLLSKLGSDRVLPSQLNIRTLKFGTPIIAIILISTLALILGEFLPWEVIAYILPTGALPAFVVTNLICIWHYRKAGPTVKNVILHGVIPTAGIVMSLWFLIMGLPIHMQMLLLLWIAIGAVFVFANMCFRPRIFTEKQGINPRNPAEETKEVIVKPKVSYRLWVGLTFSVVMLLTVISIWLIWLPNYSGGIFWWHHYYPYTSGNIIAQIMVICVCVVLAATLIYLSLRYKRRVSKNA